MRPRVDADETLENRVHTYARREGLAPPRAYAELLDDALDAEGIDA